MTEASDTSGSDRAGTSTGTTGQPGTGPAADPWAAAIERLSDSVGEWLDAARQSFEDAAAGTYDSKALAGDIGRMTARTARDWARLVVSAAGISASIAATPIKRPATGSGTPPAGPATEQPASQAPAT